MKLSSSFLDVLFLRWPSLCLCGHYHANTTVSSCQCKCPHGRHSTRVKGFHIMAIKKIPIRGYIVWWTSWYWWYSKVIITLVIPWQYLQIGKLYWIKNKAAIALQCKSNSKLNSSSLLCVVVLFGWGDGEFLQGWIKSGMDWIAYGYKLDQHD